MDSELSAEQRKNIQFRHPEKMLEELPGTDRKTIARLHGLSPDAYDAARKEFADRVCGVAHDLMGEPEMAACVGSLPFADEQTVVGFGDSITDDLQSWFEVVRRCFSLVRDRDNISFINRGNSGDTTTHAISRFGDVVGDDPDWIICMLGTNDVRLHGGSPTKSLVSAEEFAANLDMLRNYGTVETDARWLWITPPPVIEEKVKLGWGRGDPKLMWRNEDIHRICDAIRRRDEPVVNLQETFSCPPDACYFQPDGLHPSLEGQKLIARSVLRALSVNIQ